MPDQGDKAIMESNTKTLKDARAKIKIAHNDLITAKKDSEAIVKILSKDKKIEKNSDNKEKTSTTTSVRTEN
jgi:uncharacterized protein (DUF2344 family)